MSGAQPSPRHTAGAQQTLSRRMDGWVSRSLLLSPIISALTFTITCRVSLSPWSSLHFNSYPADRVTCLCHASPPPLLLAPLTTLSIQAMLLPAVLPETQTTSNRLNPRSSLPPGGGSCCSLLPGIFFFISSPGGLWHPLLDPPKTRSDPDSIKRFQISHPPLLPPVYQSSPRTSGPSGRCITNMHEHESMNMHSPGEPWSLQRTESVTGISVSPVPAKAQPKKALRTCFINEPRKEGIGTDGIQPVVPCSTTSGSPVLYKARPPCQVSKSPRPI